MATLTPPPPDARPHVPPDPAERSSLVASIISNPRATSAPPPPPPSTPALDQSPSASSTQSPSVTLPSRTIVALGLGFVGAAFGVVLVTVLLRVRLVAAAARRARRQGEHVTFTQMWERWGGWWGLVFAQDGEDDEWDPNRYRVRVTKQRVPKVYDVDVGKDEVGVFDDGAGGGVGAGAGAGGRDTGPAETSYSQPLALWHDVADAPTPRDRERTASTSRPASDDLALAVLIRMPEPSLAGRYRECAVDGDIGQSYQTSGDSNGTGANGGGTSIGIGSGNGIVKGHPRIAALRAARGPASPTSPTSPTSPLSPLSPTSPTSPDSPDPTNAPPPTTQHPTAQPPPTTQPPPTAPHTSPHPDPDPDALPYLMLGTTHVRTSLTAAGIDTKAEIEHFEYVPVANVMYRPPRRRTALAFVGDGYIR